MYSLCFYLPNHVNDHYKTKINTCNSKTERKKLNKNAIDFKFLTYLVIIKPQNLVAVLQNTMCCRTRRKSSNSIVKILEKCRKAYNLC